MIRGYRLRHLAGTAIVREFGELNRLLQSTLTDGDDRQLDKSKASFLHKRRGAVGFPILG